MFETLAWIVVFWIAIASLGLLLAQNWRWLMAFLAAQYLGVFFLTLQNWTLAMASVKVIAGWIGVTILGMSRSGLMQEDANQSESAVPAGRLFRLFAAGLIYVIAIVGTPTISLMIADAPYPVTAGALVLIGMGLLHLGTTNQALRVTIGLMTALSGFEALYATIEGSILVAALLAVINLGLALVGAYLMIASHSSQMESQ